MKYIAVIFLFLSMHALAGPKVYVFDCGTVSMANLDMFNIQAHESSVRELFIPCYVIKHDKGVLFWDAGLPKTVVDAQGPVEFAGGKMIYNRWIVDQLADIGIAPADITHAAYSHLHFDHAGAANAMVANTVLMQRTEWDAAFKEGHEFVDTTLFDGIKQANLTLIDGDYDVFGDGSVKLIYAPGHTPGHQALFVKLNEFGPLVISGDLYHTQANRTLRRVPKFNYNAEQSLASIDKVEKLIAATGATLWIEHDKELADTLKKAPNYYD